MTAIFIFSSQPGEVSGALSGGILRVLLGWSGIDGPAELIDLLHLLLRKFAHFSIYALLGIGVMGTALTFEGKSWKKFLLALVICAGYAVTDESHQLFVGARCGSPLDVMLDSCGQGTAAVWQRRRIGFGGGYAAVMGPRKTRDRIPEQAACKLASRLFVRIAVN